MQLNLNEDLLRVDGFTEAEITSIRQYLEAAPFLDNTATVVRLRGEIKLVCRTVGLAIKAVRPESYLGSVEEATMKRRKTAELHLPIFKQGDDLGACLRQHGTVREALTAYSEMLGEAQAIVTALAAHGHQLEVTQADTHFIEIEGPSPLVDELIEKGLLSPPPDDTLDD